MSNLSVNAITNAAGGNTATINGMTPTAQSLQGFRNRVINGNMVIDQRNAGASVTINGTAPYVLDRYFAQDDTDGSFTVQQSSVAPTSFNNSMIITVATTDTSLGATQLARIIQRIEGFNVADLGWGSASAQAVTLSFWVRSSLTGSFGGSLVNGANNRSYPFSYTISAANTWEQKTITVAGDTTGTWIKNNGIGLELNITLAAGSTYSGTAGAWSGSLLFSATGATNVLATSGATFYITGVQLEAGSVATPFERRPYGTELALCQRYYAVQRGAAQGYANSTGSSGDITTPLYFPVTMRAIPTVTLGASDFTSSVSTFCDAFTTGYARFYIRPSATGNQYDIGRVINLAAEL